MKKTLLTLLTLLILSTTAQAVEKIGSWQKMPIKVYIEDNRNAYLMKRAFGDWESDSNKTVEFEYVDNENEADILVLFTEKVSDFSKQAVGLTHSQVDNNKNYVKAVIEIAKFAEGSKIKLSNLELTKIMRHEIGHALGLPHTNEPYSIMNPTTDKVLKITKYDIKTLKEIYKTE